MLYLSSCTFPLSLPLPLPLRTSNALPFLLYTSPTPTPRTNNALPFHQRPSGLGLEREIADTVDACETTSALHCCYRGGGGAYTRVRPGQRLL